MKMLPEKFMKINFSKEPMYLRKLGKKLNLSKNKIKKRTIKILK